MPLPAFTNLGFLPAGVHEATLAEVAERFDSLNASSRRAFLWSQLQKYLKDVRATGLVHEVILDGSFVSNSENPGDIDLILVTPLGATLPQVMDDDTYQVLSRQRVSATLEFDVLVGEEASPFLGELIDFFQQVRHNPGVRKGLVRIRL
jgi:hypothetical protein